MPMWDQFRKSKLSVDDIIGCFKEQNLESFSNVKTRLTELSAKASTIDELVKEMDKESMFDKCCLEKDSLHPP